MPQNETNTGPLYVWLTAIDPNWKIYFNSKYQFATLDKLNTEVSTIEVDRFAVRYFYDVALDALEQAPVIKLFADDYGDVDADVARLCCTASIALYCSDQPVLHTLDRTLLELVIDEQWALWSSGQRVDAIEEAIFSIKEYELTRGA